MPPISSQNHETQKDYSPQSRKAKSHFPQKVRTIRKWNRLRVFAVFLPPSNEEDNCDDDANHYNGPAQNRRFDFICNQASDYAAPKRACANNKGGGQNNPS